MAGPGGQNSGKKASVAELRVQSLELRKQGLTFDQIGAQMGKSRQRANQLVLDENHRSHCRAHPAAR